MTNLNADKLEAAIRNLPQVHAARILLAEDSNVVEKIHVMAAPESSPKKIIRDIETLLLLRFNLKVDYRRISLIKARPEDIKPFTRPRLRLMAVEKRDGPDGRRVAISLERGDETHLGVADGPPDTAMLALAAQATIDALKPMVPEAALTLDLAECVSIKGQELIVVAVRVDYDRGTEKLLGSSFLQSDAVTVAARATLDAVNRSLFNI
jgi:hypothetical protein